MSKKKRGCGSRQAGGVYAETRTSPYGVPLEEFLADPPIPVDPAELGLTARGVKLIDVEGVWHVFDIVGKKYYPNVADYIEETRRMGASRRLPSNLDFSKLGPESRLVLVHQKAVILNFSDYDGEIVCPKDIHQHPLQEMCAALWWRDFDPKDLVLGTRAFLHFAYAASPRPEGVQPIYQHGIFMMLPITNLAVIKGGEKTEKNYKAAQRGGLPVFLEDE